MEDLLPIVKRPSETKQLPMTSYTAGARVNITIHHFPFFLIESYYPRFHLTRNFSLVMEI